MDGRTDGWMDGYSLSETLSRKGYLGDVCQESKGTLKMNHCGSSLIVRKQLAEDDFDRRDIINI